jgi:hypothetical protein
MCEGGPVFTGMDGLASRSIHRFVPDLFSGLSLGRHLPPEDKLGDGGGWRAVRNDGVVT